MELDGLSVRELHALRENIDAELRRRDLQRRCSWCGEVFTAGSRKARFCSDRCRVASHRDRLPDELTSRNRWVRRIGKRPVTVNGFNASVSDPATWNTFDAATSSHVGDGLGFVLGDGIACWDFDHCVGADGTVADTLLELICSLHPFRVETSISGTGLHAWVVEPESGNNFRRVIDGFMVEHYTRGRYIALGHRLPASMWHK